ncbi:hypothetical protein [Stenotrophomonas sp.]|uniref:hypothetical protein n=1 Tax=Stenotrophomonas sp. TaxID=69392 RepID=UPI00289E3CB6|nr:hypothetical protein [Stenotrophomonas sp.]
MRLILILSALLMLAGCATTAPDTTASSSDNAPVPALGGAADAAAAEADCAAVGGQLMPLGRLQRVQCVVPYADAGKSCRTKSDCSGQCLASGDTEVAPGSAATGVCQRDISQNFGCRQRIDGGLAQGTICVD